MRISFLLLFLFSIAACTSQQTASHLLSPEALPRQIFKINTAKDTTLKTLNGALIELGSGSFSVSGEVELEIKEAFSFEDIIGAGLTTQSDGKPLSSDGMIYIDAVDEDIQLVKAIRISLPTDKYDVEMALYKGDEKGSEINWVQPAKLEDTISPYLNGGKNLFNANCATCHSYDQTLTGPAMKGLELRGPWNNRTELLKFTENVGGYLSTNCYTKNLINEYKQIMPSFPGLGKPALNAIYDYLKYEDIKRGIATANNYVKTACDDSCYRYDSVRYSAEDKITNLSLLRQELIDSNENRINYERMNNSGTAEMPPGLRDGNGMIEKVTPQDFTAAYYRFDITSFGWYNIDKLQDVAKNDESSLLLTVDESLSSEIDVFIAVPEYKVFDRGGKLSDNAHYGFFTLNGKLPLPVGVKVVVFALSEADGKILYDYREFISTATNEITLTPRPATKEEFNAAVKKFSLETISIQANDSKNADEIRKADKEIKTQEALLESFRPNNCDCSCGLASDSTKTPTAAEVYR